MFSHLGRSLESNWRCYNHHAVDLAWNSGFDTSGLAGETNDVNVRSILIKLPTDVFLGGGFKHFLFSPLLGEMIQIDTTR